ncbi:hypothetical protein C8R47DRAFT_1286610 [Mycena vitilis]|nr:hypothetical protein C8R47DRAFT_1286610 [Mycena vitilis]
MHGSKGMKNRKNKRALAQIAQDAPDTTGELVVESLGASGVSSKRIKLSDVGVVLKDAPPSTASALPTPAVEEAKKKTVAPTRNATIIAQFKACRKKLGNTTLDDAILSHEMDATMGQACYCGSGAVREAICHDCLQYPASCLACVLKDHKYNYLHWLERWDPNTGFYTRHDMSVVGPPLQLGHHGDPCGNLKPDVQPLTVIIVHTNGIHNTKLNWCAHTAEKGVQAMIRARLFPATYDTPESAYTFEVMKAFQIHHLESNTSAYDYCGGLMRLTDNAFAESNVQDIYDSFVRAAHLWGFISTEKRMGQMHGVDDVLSHRPKGNLVLYCPACPEPGFNMDPVMPTKLDAPLRHLNQERLTLDGNFQCNKAKKSARNSDPNDRSLAEGRSYFPEHEAQKKYLLHAPKTPEKSTCNYLKAVNNQDKKKFKNMEITGIVNTQCSHVFVRASVDLEIGERFVNVDASLAHALRQKLISGVKGQFTIKLELEIDSVDRVLSYDIACQYHVNIKKRFENESLKDLLPLVSSMRWAVPALHVRGHQSSCIYAYSAAYMEATGHFHGETAEQYWPELNQIGPLVRQMNNGHRQDTVILHHGDWNFKKMAKMVAALVADLNEAKCRFAEFQAHFFGLCGNLVARIDKENWWDIDRKCERISGKVVKSPYMYDADLKVPSQFAIYTQMLSDEVAMLGTNVSRSRAALVLHEGILIQDTQNTIRELVAAYEEHPLASTQREIENRRSKAVIRVAKWRSEQITLMPSLGDLLETRAACEIEKEQLYLPSDFNEQERPALGLASFAVEEAKLREGAAYDALKSVQVVAKALGALRERKKKHDHGQRQHTASLAQVQDTERRRDKHIRNYMVARAALQKLGACTGEADDFPALTVSDTLMGSRSTHRGAGGSRPSDGWAAGGIAVGGKVRKPHLPASNSAPGPAPMPVGTVMAVRRRSGKEKMATSKPGRKLGTTDKVVRPAGWLWTFGKMGKMSAQEMQAWSADGKFNRDKVQWFRAEGNMKRWQEQMEAKLAELRTTIRSFRAYKNAWETMGARQNPEKIGHVAYAKQKAAMFAAREESARAALRAYPEYASLEKDDADLVAFVSAAREEHKKALDLVLDSAREMGRAGQDKETMMDIDEEMDDDEEMTD